MGYRAVQTNVERRHYIPQQRHRVANSAAYDLALRKRDGLPIWFTDAAIAAWKADLGRLEVDSRATLGWQLPQG